MRLLQLQCGSFSLAEYPGNSVPRYAILSHTWGEESDEVTFEDLMMGTGRSKKGYNKLTFCGNQAKHDGLQYFWIDTCCINKADSSELSEALNSMFIWYRNAAKCYVYLADVKSSTDSNGVISNEVEQEFDESRWFTRGWTLQELVAPNVVEFFSAEGVRIGDKRSLGQRIQKITRIDIQVLQGKPLSDISEEERMSWANGRETTRPEDTAYYLLGIFEIHMPLIYGEGQRNAMRRLRKEIKEAREDDLSVNDQSSWLQSSGTSLSGRVEQSAIVEISGEQIANPPQDYEDHVTNLVSLADNLMTQYEETRALVDLDKAIDAATQAVKATPQNHPDQVDRLRSLGTIVAKRFENYGLQDDFIHAVQVFERAVNALSHDHPNRTTILTQLGVLHCTRFDGTGSMENLNRAIEFATEAMEGTAQDHQDRADRLESLGDYLHKRFKERSSIGDLDSAIEVTNMAVEVIPEDHSNRPSILGKLREMWYTRVEQPEVPTDLEGAVRVAVIAALSMPQNQSDRENWQIIIEALLKWQDLIK